MGRAMGIGDVWHDVNGFLDWLGVHPSLQDFVKAGMLIAFALAILMILGDIYRGEIQNTFHRVRLIPHPSLNGTTSQTMQVPNQVVNRTLHGVFSNLLVYYRYRDHLGRMRTRKLYHYRVRFKSRPRYTEATAPGTELEHQYSEDEASHFGKELPEVSEPRKSEIVSLHPARVDLLREHRDARIARASNIWSKLSRSKFRRLLAGGVKEADLVEPEFVGYVVKFHFPIDPFFLLYRHPDQNVRSTAWLTVLTSVFAIFMQLVFSSGPLPIRRMDDAGATLTSERQASPASLPDTPRQSALRPTIPN